LKILHHPNRIAATWAAWSARAPQAIRLWLLLVQVLEIVLQWPVGQLEECFSFLGHLLNELDDVRRRLLLWQALHVLDQAWPIWLEPFQDPLDELKIVRLRAFRTILL
jgi:hypothetical protein